MFADAAAANARCSIPGRTWTSSGAALECAGIDSPLQVEPLLQSLAGRGDSCAAAPLLGVLV